MLERRTGQHSEAERAVRIIAGTLAVDELAVEHARVVDQEGPRAVGQRRLEDTDLGGIATHAEREPIDFTPSRVAAVARQYHRGVPAGA